VGLLATTTATVSPTTVLAMLAQALLGVLTATTRPPDRGSGVIPFDPQRDPPTPGRGHRAHPKGVAHPALVHLDDDIKPAPEQST
jgi:hypothetical protein